MRTRTKIDAATGDKGATPNIVSKVHEKLGGMGNVFGRLFRLITFGESHGKAVGCVVEGCPAGLELSEELVQQELDRRRPAQSWLTTQRAERDEVEILSGVFEDKTLGTPILMLIRNVAADSKPYEAVKRVPRPGHADFTWRAKFGHFDWRGGGRASGRETVARVAGGAVAKLLLQRFGIEVVGFATEIGGVCVKGKPRPKSVKEARELKKRVEANPVRAPSEEEAEAMVSVIERAMVEKDSVGGVVEIVAVGVPAGLGEPVFDKLDAELAKALMSIPAVKGVEIGEGFKLTKLRGSEANDEFRVEGGKVTLLTNMCGGILGGISAGTPIVARIAVKPTASIGKPQRSVNLETLEEREIVVEGLHDPCIVPRVVPVAEAMVALVLADHMIISGRIPRSIK